MVVYSSNDEFMQFDWSELWYNEIKGETHLLIVPNSEHSLSTGIPELIQVFSVFAHRIVVGHTEAERPTFNYTYDSLSGELTVQIPEYLSAY